VADMKFSEGAVAGRAHLTYEFVVDNSARHSVSVRLDTFLSAALGSVRHVVEATHADRISAEVPA